MIKKKNIIILLAVVIVLGAATAALFMWDGTADETAESDFSTGETIYIYDGNEEELSKINVTLPDEEFEFVKLEEDKWQITGLEGTSIKNYSIQMLAGDLSKLTAKSIVEENASDLAKYGLDNPAHKITGTFAGVEKTFYAGNATPLNDGYYFKDSETNTVYTIYTTRYTSLFASKESYRDITFVKVDTAALKSISINKADSEISLNAMENPIQMSGYTLAGWEMTKPLYNLIDDSRLTTMITEKLAQISVDSVVSDKGDYAAYGLDKPYATVTLTDTADVTQTIKISPAKDGDFYAVTEGDISVYLLGGEPMGFVDVNPFDLISKFAHICSIDDVSSVAVAAGEEAYTLSVSGADEEKTYKLNDADIDEDTFKKELYQSVIGLICNDFCNDAAYGAPDVTIEYTMNDGSKDKLEFVSYNDRNYAVFKNGTCSMQILKKEVNAVVETLKNHVK